jgi:hypothetical protein
MVAAFAVNRILTMGVHRQKKTAQPYLGQTVLY